MDDMLTASAQTVLADLCPPALVRAVETARQREPARALWQQLDALGFLDALIPTEHGGAGLRLADCAGVLMAFGQHALPLPAAHTLLARRWLAQAGIAAPRGPIALAIADTSADAERPSVAFAPYGAVAEALLLATPEGARLVMLDPPDGLARVADHRGDLDITLALPPSPRVGQPVPWTESRDAITEGGALVTAAVMAGAMQRVLDITIAYVTERQQFGRPISKFQAIQQQLSVMAEHVAATRMAAQLGCAAHGAPGQRLLAAIAKARASRAAPLVANGAHALIGALGITAEFDLQLHTRRLHAQRLHYGAESFWDEVVGAHALSHWDSTAHGVIGLTNALVNTLTDGAGA